MSLRDRLAALVGRRREAAPIGPAEPVPSPAEPAPSPVEPAPRPRIVLLGTEPRALGLIEIYGLAGREDVALSDRRPGRDAGEGIVKLAGFGARSITRQHCAGVHAAIWAQVSCRHTRKASARARRY